MKLSASNAISLRNPGLDLVRVIGVLAIVAGHIWLNEPLHRLVFAWHVPIFFFLSGYLWKRRSVREEFSARSRTLLKPYLFWFTALYLALAVEMITVGGVSIGSWLGPIYGGVHAYRPFTTFWFVFTLFAAAMLWQFVSHADLWVRSVVVVLALASTAFGPLLASTPLAIGSALPAVVFVAAGQWARTIETSLPGRVWIAAGVGVASFVLVWSGITAPLDIKYGDWGTPVVSVAIAIAISWSFVTLALAFCTMLPHPVGRVITSFAMCGFTIVLVHPAVLSILAWLPDPALFLAAVLIPTLIALVARRTPLSQWATGAPRIAGAVMPKSTSASR